MSRERMDGTPKDFRSKRWIFPSRANATLWLSLSGNRNRSPANGMGFRIGITKVFAGRPVDQQIMAAMQTRCARQGLPERAVVVLFIRSISGPG